MKQLITANIRANLACFDGSSSIKQINLGTFFFQNQKKSLGSGPKNRVGRVTRNKGFFFGFTKNKFGLFCLFFLPYVTSKESLKHLYIPLEVRGISVVDKGHPAPLPESFRHPKTKRR